MDLCKIFGELLPTEECFSGNFEYENQQMCYSRPFENLDSDVCLTFESILERFNNNGHEEDPFLHWQWSEFAAIFMNFIKLDLIYLVEFIIGFVFSYLMKRILGKFKIPFNKFFAVGLSKLGLYANIFNIIIHLAVAVGYII